MSNSGTNSITREFLVDRQLAKIGRIGSLEELGGYEAVARKRGLHPEELPALLERRKYLSLKSRRS